MGKLGCTTRGRNWGSPSKSKRFRFPLLLDINPTKKLGPPVPPLITDHMSEKKVSNNFFTNFTKNFACGVYFQLQNHD